ncbi:hypothetical protein Cgig2_023172 [Carnegiea gigantea]|uniref:Mitochondrial processing peptidase n=1 Tax=Carnegiea gigantea TaxID=171969 RepID=A0A9Q1JY38_9CARY|nr:hypothetical protein Cgig2_023172 [Carnegiea gigantea]
MSTRNLIRQTLRRSSHLHHHHRRHYATHSAVATTEKSPLSFPFPPPPNVMIYDRLAESVKSKLKRLDEPDPRFRRYASPNPTSSDHTQILQFPETRITTLPNGLRVATESNLAAKSAAVGIWVDAGSRFDPEDKSGVAHFLEQLVLKAENEEVENIGAQLDGFTTRDITWYSALVSGQNVGKGVEVLGQILQNPDFSEGKIDKVRNAILKERDQISAGGDLVIFDQLHATAFQYTPLGRPIVGPVHDMKLISKADIQEYFSSHYAAHRMVISASGAVKHEDVVEQVKKAFTKLSANPTTTSQLVASDPANFTGSEVRIIDDDLPLAQFAVAFEGASVTDPDSVTLMVMQTMLGSWSKKDGAGKHVGYPDCLDDLSYAIMHEVSKLSYRVTEDDVIRARNQLKSSLIRRCYGISGVAEDIGQQLLTYGRRIPFAELFARIDAVDASAVKHAADRFLFDKDIAIAAMGPIKGLPDYNWFRRRTYWLRY